jgi:hypothetical protein
MLPTIPILPLTIAVIVVVLAAAAGLVLTVRNYLKYRRVNVVTCPETKEPARVRLNAKRAAAGELIGRTTDLELKSCSRWPERANCGRECLSQIENNPAACQALHIAQEWFEGRNCAYCGKAIGEIHWHDHPPALLSPEHRTTLWNKIAPENLAKTLENHAPVCWSCHMAETFRRNFPERVVDRPWQRGAMGEYRSAEEHEELAKSGSRTSLPN